MQPPKTLEISVKSQFIKDLSFENFNTLINTEKSQPLDYKININVKIEKEKDAVSQVILYLFCEAFHIKDKVYILEIEYGGNFEIKSENIKEKIHVLSIECSKLLFPFLRRIAYDITRESGFSPLNIKPIDFSQTSKND